MLFVQDDIADKVIGMLAGAMAELKVGDPGLLSTDVGPVIDVDAKCVLDEHAARMQSLRRSSIAKATLGDGTAHGTFFAPTAWELKSIAELRPREIRPGAARGALEGRRTRRR